jgi:hypothetical protein
MTPKWLKIKYDALGVLEIVSPERTNAVLAAYIPNREINSLEINGLHNES